MTRGLLLFLLIAAGCASTEPSVPVDKPLVEAEPKDYSFDHIDGLEDGLAGEGLQVARIIGGLNALQKEVNSRLSECPVRGKVTLVYVVDEGGKVLDAAPATGIHEKCDAIAVDAVKQMEFVPATKNGVPVRIRMGTAVVFN